MVGIHHLGDSGGRSPLGHALQAEVDKAMDAAGGNVPEAARRLGVSFSALYRWIREGRVVSAWRYDHRAKAWVRQGDGNKEAVECQPTTEAMEPR